MHIEQALSTFLVQLQADGRSKHTLQQYARHVRLLARWRTSKGRPDNIAAIDHESIAAFLVSDEATHRPDGKPKKATAMNALRTSIRCFFKYQHAAGHVAADPSRLVRRAHCGIAPPRALSDDEVRRLVGALDKAVTWDERRDRVLFLTMLGTGIRLGSALALEMRDVDLDAGELWIRRAKGDRPSRVFLPSATAQVLGTWNVGRSNGTIFGGRGRRQLSARHVQRRFRRWLIEAGIRRPASPHSLRHTFATRLYAKTRDLAVVKAALGHRSIASTLVYASAGPEQVRQALDG